MCIHYNFLMFIGFHPYKLRLCLLGHWSVLNFHDWFINIYNFQVAYTGKQDGLARQM